MIGPIFTKKAFEKVGISEKEISNENFKIFIKECQNDKEMNISLKNINFRKDFNENELKANNENPKFSNIDSFFKNDFNKRKKLALFYCFQNALNLIKDIKIINN